MPQGRFERQPQIVDRSPGGRAVLAGIVGACALGVGLGLWARPASEERHVRPVPPPAPVVAIAPERVLQIVVEDEPAPLGQLLEVLPPDALREPPRLAPPVVEPLAPRPAPFRLTKVDKLASPPPESVEPPKPKIRAAPVARPAPGKDAPPAKADAKRAAKPEVTKPAPDVRTANAATKAAPKSAKAETAKPKPARLAAATTPPPKAKPLPPPKPAPAKPADAKLAAEPRGAGGLRAAQGAGCASADPGEALVCADPRLGRRDQQLRRIYGEAQAAGVPAAALLRRQQQWLAARAAAAREAPWAVEDVYVARIAELKDMIRDVRDRD